jgi:hypothetical protein
LQLHRIGAAPILALALTRRADREPKPIAPLCELGPGQSMAGAFFRFLMIADALKKTAKM